MQNYNSKFKNKINKFTAVFQKNGRWYLGWIKEISGVNTQGKTFQEVKNNLKEAFLLIFEDRKTCRDLGIAEIGKKRG